MQDSGENYFYEPKWDNSQHIKMVTEKNNSWGMHFHLSCEIAYVLSGSVDMTINGEKFTIGEDEIAFINPLYKHKYENIEGHKKIVLILPPAYTKEFNYIFDSYAIKTKLTNRSLNQKIKAKCLELLDYLEEKNSPSHMVVQGYLSLILGFILEGNPLEPKIRDKATEKFSDILTYINENLTEKLTLQSVARRFGYERTYFSKIFKAMVGNGVAEYIAIVRCRQFLKLAKQKGNVNIAELALESGFDSMSSFYRAFRKYYNVSPIEYLRKND